MTSAYMLAVRLLRQDRGKYDLPFSASRSNKSCEIWRNAMNRNIILHRLLYLVILLFASSIITLCVLYVVPEGPFACARALQEEKNPEGFAEEVVYGLIATKLNAMETKDINRYLTLIDETDKEYYTEQYNWFMIYQDAVISDFSIKVLKAVQVDDATIVATLCQRYLYGSEKDERNVRYETRFVKTPAGWKDADLNFQVKETPHFIIKYPQKAETQAKEVSKAAEVAYETVVKDLRFESQSKFKIKLYVDRKMLRETADIRVPYLYNGWSEAGESVKMYAYREGSAELLIAHELVHNITLTVTDSQPAWFSEGLAAYFGNRPFAGGNPVQLESSTAEELSRPINWLDENALHEITDGDTRKLYNDMSAMVVEFIVETYEPDKLQAILVELSKYPRYESGYSTEWEPEMQDRLYKSIEIVLGLSKDEFNQKWLAWISSQ